MIQLYFPEVLNMTVSKILSYSLKDIIAFMDRTVICTFSGNTAYLYSRPFRRLNESRKLLDD